MSLSGVDGLAAVGDLRVRVWVIVSPGNDPGRPAQAGTVDGKDVLMKIGRASAPYLHISEQG